MQANQIFIRDRNANFYLIPNSGIGMSVDWRFLTDNGKAYGILVGKTYSADLFMWDQQNGIVRLGKLPGHIAHIIGVNNIGQVLISCVLEADPYTQVTIDLLQVTCPVIFYTPSKSFAIQVPYLTYDL
jgi:hypothetical protein